VLKLLDAGAKVQLRGLFGETALHWAALLAVLQTGVF
jgi:ankyrin repeat protein